MTQQVSILIVDDDPFMRELICNALEDFNHLTAESGEACLAAVAQSLPELILLDVEMPGVDGYETCRRLKADVAAAVPVIFLSAHDEIEDRLRGYEAGADDYLVKPFDPIELRAKIANLLQARADKSQLQERADYAGRTAMTAMTTLGELGALLQAIQRFNTCVNNTSLADEVLFGIALYDLGGVVQIRLPNATISRSAHGAASPLEISVIGHMAGMERIVQFKTRLSITYDHVSLLINNMPVTDPDRCGRLRDHLAALVDSAEMRVRSLLVTEQSDRRGVAIARAVQSATLALDEIDHAHRESGAALNVAIHELVDAIERAYIGLGLTDGQEAMLSEFVRSGVDKILSAHALGTDIGDRLTGLVAELKNAAATS